MMNDAPGTTRVSIGIPGKAACDMAVPADRVIDFCAEAKRRGLLVRYKLRGSKTTSTVMAGPGDTTEALRQRLTAEFGDRLAFEHVDDPLFELRERVKRFIAETPTDDDDSFEFAYTPANKARDLAEVETADEAKLREWERHRTNCERLGPKPPIDGELA